MKKLVVVFLAALLAVAASAEGGCLCGVVRERECGTVNECAALTVGTGGGKIRVGAGAALAFADSKSAQWDGSVALEADGDEIPPGALRFGTSARGLTARQVAKMSFNGRRVHLRPDGTVSSIPVGMAISFR